MLAEFVVTTAGMREVREFETGVVLRDVEVAEAGLVGVVAF